MSMIPKKIYIMLLLAGAMAFTACDDTEDGSYTAPITQYERIAGTWVLNSVTQVDETTSKTMDLTSAFDFSTFVIHLNCDEKGNPTTFAIDGSAPTLLPTTGTWKLQNPFVNTDGSSAVIVLNDKVNLTVTGLPGTKKVLEYKFTRRQNGKAFVSYVYNLNQLATE